MKKRLLALLLVLSLVVSMVPTAFAAEGGETINYVSLGDSMANGYCFEGYKQDSNDINVYDFVSGEGMYGKDAYPLQFEEYLTEKGYTVEHTKLAPSALLAEDLLWLLGGRDEFNDGWNGLKDYVGTYSADELKAHFQKAVTEADIMTIGVGNASFGAFLVQMIANAFGVMGSTPEIDPNLTLENGLALLESAAARELVMKVYADMKAIAASYQDVVPANLDALMDIVAYTTASYIVNYEACVDKILELNTQEDLEIILVGLMNTTYGMVITGDGFEFPFGDMMDSVFGALNAYMAGLPALKQELGLWTDATFYYAEQPDPDFIVMAFDDLAAENWGNIDKGRLSGETVRQRNIKAYNDGLRDMIGSALGFVLPAVTLADVKNYVIDEDYTSNMGWMDEYNTLSAAEKAKYTGKGYEAYGEYASAVEYDINKQISVAIYVAIEEAVVDSVDNMEITVDGLMGIAGDIFKALGPMPEVLAQSPKPATIKNALVEWFTKSENGPAMCKVYALFKVGNGMSVHPTPTGHDNIAEAVIAAYEGDDVNGSNTVDKELAAILAQYPGAPVIKNIYVYLRGNNYITDDQTVEILNFVYDAVKDGTCSDRDLRNIAIFVYYTVLRSGEEMPVMLFAEDPELTPEQKLEIIMTLYRELKASPDLNTEAYPELETVAALCEELTEGSDPLINAEQAMAIINKTFDTVVVEELPVEEAITEITEEINTQILANPDVPAEKKAQIIEKVAAALEGSGTDSAIPELAVVEALRDALEAKGYLTKEQQGKIVEAVADVLPTIVAGEQLTQDQMIEIVDKVYGIVFNREDLTIEDKIDIVLTVYGVLEEYGYIDSAYEMAYGKADEMGYVDQAADYVGVAIATVATAKGVVANYAVTAELEAVKAALLAEIDATAETLAAIKALLEGDAFATRDSAWAAMMALSADLDNHIENMKELAQEVGFAIDPYINQVVTAAKYYANLIDTVCKDAYAWVVNGVEEFADEYAAFVEEAGKVADKIDPRLGAAVRKYLTETPEQALAIIYGSGEDALDAVMIEAVAAYGDVKEIVIGLASVLDRNDIEAIAKAVIADPEVQELIKAIEAKRTELEKLVAEKAALPAATTKEIIENYDAIIAGLEAEIAVLQGELVDAIIAAAAIVDPALKPLLNKAVEALKEAAAAVEIHVGHLDGRMEKIVEQMLGDLLYLIIDQTQELGDVAGPVIAEIIEKLLKCLAENAEELFDYVVSELIPAIIDAISDAIKQYGDEAWEIIKPYLDKLIELADPEKIESLLNQLVDELKDMTKEQVNALIDVLKDALAELKKAVSNDPNLMDLIAKVENVIAAIEKLVNDPNATVEELQAALKDLQVAVEELIDAAMTSADAAVQNAIDKFKAAYEDATSGTYEVTADSYYVAIGDGSAVSNSYVDKLAEELGVEYNNLAENGQTIETAPEVITSNVSEFAKADLVTIGYNNTAFVYSALNGFTPDYDAEWDAMLGTEGAKAVEKALAELEAYLVKEGSMNGMESRVINAVEAYAYSAAAYATGMPEIINAIHEINEDALIVIVGMYNPLEDVTINFNGIELDLANYLDYVVDAANLHGVLCAMGTDAIFVEASDVETKLTDKDLGDLMEIMNALTDGVKPSEAGHEYIKDQILDAVTAEYQLGDVDLDGDVDSDDVTALLRHVSRIEFLTDSEALENSDVNQDGQINSDDVTRLLRYVSKIDISPLG